MSDPPRTQNVAEGMKWATRATTIALEMVFPGLAGQWADKQLGTSFLTLLGFALGLTVALLHLLQLARQAETERLSKLNSKTHDSQTTDDLPAAPGNRSNSPDGDPKEP